MARAIPNGVRLIVTTVGAVAALCIARPASAEDLVSGYGEAVHGHSTMTGDMADDFFNTAGSKIGAGMRFGRFAVGASLAFASYDSKDESRHGFSVQDVAIGPELKVFLGGNDGFRPYLRGGISRHWLSGSTDVVRQCADFDVCENGFFTEEPSYTGHGVRGGIGLEYLMKRPARGHTLVAFSAEISYEQLRFSVVDQPFNGGMIGLSIGISVGGGRLVPTPPTTMNPSRY